MTTTEAPSTSDRPALSAGAGERPEHPAVAAPESAHTQLLTFIEAHTEAGSLGSWVGDAVASLLRGTLADEDRATLERLLGADRAQEVMWAGRYQQLVGYCTEQTYIDFGCDITMSRPELAWARSQQRAAFLLNTQQRRQLEELPGWSWHTDHDRLAAGSLPGLLYLAHAGPSEERTLPHLVSLLPVEAVGHMCSVDDPAGRRVGAVLRRAQEPDTHQRGQLLLLLTSLLDAAQRTDPVMDRFASRVSDLTLEEAELRVFSLFSDVASLRPDPAAAVPVATQRVHPSLGNVPPAAPSLPVLGSMPGVEVSMTMGVPTWQVRVDHPLAHRHIACLGLSTRTHNALVRAGITKVGEVMAIEDPHVLLSLRGFGETCLANLHSRLVEHGIEPLFGAVLHDGA